MSLGRFALRIAAKCALRPPGATTWPTMAGEHVYLSQIKPIEDLADKHRRPIVVVNTGDGTNEPRGANLGIGDGGFPRAMLVVDISILQAERDGDDIVVGYPVGDADLDAQLDLMEHQVLGTIMRSKLVRAVTPYGVRTLSSTPYWSSERSAMVAARQIVMDYSIYDDRDGNTLTKLAAMLPASDEKTLLLAMAGAALADPPARTVPMTVVLNADLGDGSPEIVHTEARVTLDPAATDLPADPLGGGEIDAFYPVPAIEPEPETDQGLTDPRPPDTVPRT